MKSTASSNEWRPGAVMVGAIATLFGMQALVFVTTAVGLSRDRDVLPQWFVAVFGLIAALFVTLAYFYGRAAYQRELLPPASGDGITATTLILLPVSIVCTSSLHRFYPFRFSVMRELQGIPWAVVPPAPLLRFNFAFTAAAFIATVALAIMYAAGGRRAAMIGMVTLAAVLLIPNDNCANTFNRPWVASIGASPVMFASSSIGLLVAACGLCQLWRRTSLAILASICVGTLLVGIGHMSQTLW